MKSSTRFLTLLGAGMLAAATFAVPAQAAPLPSASAMQMQRDWRHHHDDDWDVEDVYNTRGQCERAGWRGERRGEWYDYECERVRRGPDRGDWKLLVRDDDHDWDWRRR